MYVSISLFISLYVYMYIYTYIYIYKYVDIYIYIYIYYSHVYVWYILYIYTYIYVKPSKWFTWSSAEYLIGRMFYNNGRSKKQLKDLIHAFTIIRHALSFSTFQRLVLLTIIVWCWTKITSSLLKPQNFERTKLYQAWIYIYIFKPAQIAR